MSNKTEDPRKAMLRVRGYVKAFMSGRKPKGKKITDLSQYPSTVADKKRTIIALQDLLEDSMTKHTKASNLIENFKINFTAQCEDFNRHILSQRSQIKSYKEEIESLTAVIKHKDEAHEDLRKQHFELRDTKRKYQDALAKLQNENNAAMITLKSSLNSSEVGYSPAPHCSAQMTCNHESMMRSPNHG